MDLRVGIQQQAGCRGIENEELATEYDLRLKRKGVENLYAVDCGPCKNTR